MITKELEIISLIEKHPKMVGFDYIPPKLSDKFSTQQHLSCLIGAFLSNQKPWKCIHDNWQRISAIFLILIHN